MLWGWRNNLVKAVIRVFRFQPGVTVAQFCALFWFGRAHIISASFFRPSTFKPGLLSPGFYGSSEEPARWSYLTVFDPIPLFS